MPGRAPGTDPTHDPSAGTTSPATAGSQRGTAAGGVTTRGAGGVATRGAGAGTGTDAELGAAIGGELGRGAGRVATRGSGGASMRGCEIVTGRPRGRGATTTPGAPGTATPRGRRRGRPGLATPTRVRRRRPGTGTGAGTAGMPGGHHGPCRVSMQSSLPRPASLGQNSAPAPQPITRDSTRPIHGATVDGGIRSGIETPPGRPGIDGGGGELGEPGIGTSGGELGNGTVPSVPRSLTTFRGGEMSPPPAIGGELVHCPISRCSRSA